MEVNLEKQQQRGLYKSCQRPRFGGGGAPVFPPPPQICHMMRRKGSDRGLGPGHSDLLRSWGEATDLCFSPRAG